jgi:ubiquinone/menaquinone biosynthesis C-methylase UbiE
MEAFTSSFEHQPAPFDLWAETYDDFFTESHIGRAQRASVWAEIDKHFTAGKRILEINCGTGVDALHMAERGARVVACDISHEMLVAAANRLSSPEAQGSVELRPLPTENLKQIEGAAIFDGALSNFAGLNCVEDLITTVKDLARLLKPRAKLIICVFGRWCLWEMFWYLARGNPRKAFRRLGEQGATVRLKAGEFCVHYPSVQRLEQAFAPFFRLKTWKGVGIAVPPSYLEPLAIRFHRAHRVAVFLDRGLSRLPVVRSFSDHLLLIFERIAD